MNLLNNLKYLREGARETQKDVAILLGVSEMTISRYESGECNPDLDKLIVLADHYDVTVDSLLRRSFRPTTPMYAENLRHLRCEYNITREEIAKMLGYQSRRAIEFVENGRKELPLQQLLILAEFFGVTLDQFIKQDLSEVGYEK